MQVLGGVVGVLRRAHLYNVYVIKYYTGRVVPRLHIVTEATHFSQKNEK